MALAIGTAMFAVLTPGATLMFVLMVRPVVDCFWSQRVLEIGSVSLNAQAVLGVFFPLAVVVVLLLRGWLYRPRGIEFAILAYAAITAAGVLISPVPVAAAGDFGRIALPLALFWLGCQFGRTGQYRLTLPWVLSCYAFVPIVTALLQLAGMIVPVAGAVGSPLDVFRVTGFYHHPLEISMRACLALPYALATATGIHKRTHKIFLITWGLTLAVVSWVTLVRSAIVVAAVEVAGWLLLRRRRLLAGTCMAGVLAIAPLIPQVRGVVATAIRPLQEGAIYELGTGRGLLFAAQVSAFADASIFQKILGRGLHSTPGVNVRYAPTTAIDPGVVNFEEGNIGAHNQYLRVLTESGVLGLVALAATLGFTISCGWRVRRRAHSNSDSAIASATLVAVAGALIYGLTATPFDSPWVAWPLWTAIGYVRGLDLSQAGKVLNMR